MRRLDGPAPVAAVIGSPVGHSLSPAIHRAAFAAAGLEWSYVAFDVAAGRAGEALAAMRVLGIAGYSVTTPHKEQVAAGVDELAESAAALDSVNTVIVADDGRLVGHSTDGDGFVASLAAEGVDVAGMRVVVLGAGGAARSVVSALGRAGAADIAVVNRTPERVAAIAALADTAHAAADAAVAVNDATLVVNATSVGFGTDDIPLDPAWLRPEHLVADLVYHPLETALLRAAAAVGARPFDGLGMLIHQAALQQRLWTGDAPDVDAMRAAALGELARRVGEV